MTESGKVSAWKAVVGVIPAQVQILFSPPPKDYDMGMSDCMKCWDTPCNCGYDYLFEDTQRIHKRAMLLKEVLIFRRDYPQGDLTNEAYYDMFIDVTNGTKKDMYADLVDLMITEII